MHGLGLAKGDRVALLLPDCREYLEADYGTMAAGFVRVPMDPRLTRRELVALLQRAGVRALVTHPSFADKVERLTDDVETLRSIVFVGEGAGPRLRGAAGKRLRRMRCPTATATISRR